MSCGLGAWGVVRLPWGEIPTWRKNPGPAEGLRTAHLKLADEQTVVGMAAVLKACHRAGWAPTGFRDWAVLAAPKYMGRVRLAHAIDRYQKQGSRGVSPLVIPNLSQHSVAVTVSLILGSHGPNFGVGGNSHPIAEVLMNAIVILNENRRPGVWAVFTAWDQEPIPDGTGQTRTPTTGIGVALALTPALAGGEVRITVPQTFDRDARGWGTVPALAEFLEQAGPAARWSDGIGGGGTVEIFPAAAAAGEPRPLRLAG